MIRDNNKKPTIGDLKSSITKATRVYLGLSPWARSEPEARRVGGDGSVKLACKLVATPALQRDSESPALEQGGLSRFVSKKTNAIREENFGLCLLLRDLKILTKNPY